MKTSIILCTRNRINEFIRFSNSLITQTDLPCELVIVDSSDKPINTDPEYNKITNLIKKNIKVNYIHSEPGLTKQRNVGIKNAKGNILYFFDDDIVLNKNYLKVMNNIYNKKKEYKGGMGIYLNTPKYTMLKKIKKLFLSIFFVQHDYGDGKFYPSGFPKHPFGRNEFMDVEVLGGAIMSYRKEVFKDNLFDENMTNYSYMEDIDFSRRVSYKYKLFQNPDAIADHRHGQGGRGNLWRNREMLMFNHRYLFSKNFSSSLKNKIAHFWSILGMFLFALIARPNKFLVIWFAYISAIIDFHNQKKIFIKKIF